MLIFQNEFDIKVLFSVRPLWLPWTRAICSLFNAFFHILKYILLHLVPSAGGRLGYKCLKQGGGYNCLKFVPPKGGYQDSMNLLIFQSEFDIILLRSH